MFISFSRAGTETSSPAESGSAISQPSKSIREPFKENSGKFSFLYSFIDEVIFVRKVRASDICDDKVLLCIIL